MKTTSPLNQETRTRRKRGRRRRIIICGCTFERWLMVGTTLVLATQSVEWSLLSLPSTTNNHRGAMISTTNEHHNFWDRRRNTTSESLTRRQQHQQQQQARKKRGGRTYLSSRNNGNNNSPHDEDVLVETLARAYPYIQSPLPCYEPEHRWRSRSVQTTPTQQGLLFAKPFKTASSTAAGIHLRISKQLASAQQLRHEICLSRFDHGISSHLFAHRDTTKSVLWTILRNPTARAVSQYYHFSVGRHHIPISDTSFQTILEQDQIMSHHYYLYILSLQPFHTFNDSNNSASSSTTKDQRVTTTIRNIVNDYDFMAITERFDESMVALQMLLNVSLGHVLYLSSKQNGGYDDGGGKKHCTYIPPTNLTSTMQEFLQSPTWQTKIHGDLLLYNVASRSLDKTIDETLGRAAFEHQLRIFRRAQSIAHERCYNRAIFPCSDNGTYHSTTNCIWNDSGCGNDCLDEVATELGLW